MNSFELNLLLFYLIICCCCINNPLIVINEAISISHHRISCHLSCHLLNIWLGPCIHHDGQGRRGELGQHIRDELGRPDDRIPCVLGGMGHERLWVGNWRVMSVRIQPLVGGRGMSELGGAPVGRGGQHVHIQEKHDHSWLRQLRGRQTKQRLLLSWWLKFWVFWVVIT